jgi:hypothetical protein
LVNPKPFTDDHYLVNTSSDAMQLAINFERAYEVYRVFRVNADFLLLHLGLFSQNSNVLGDTYFDKGGAYYNSAASSLKQARDRRSRLSDVLKN